MSGGGLNDLIVDVVSVIKDAVGDLLVSVTHEPFTGRTDTDKPSYGAAVQRSATVVKDTRTITSADGTATLVVVGPITFYENVSVNNEDMLTLPDGSVGYIKDVRAGLLNPSGGGYMTKVWVGQ